MNIKRQFTVLVVLLSLVTITLQAKKQKSAAITNLEDIKDFKKILKTKTNVLVLFVNLSKSARSIIDVFKDTADAMKGQATLVIIDCTSESKKLCKKLKVNSEKPYHIRHYKDGDFHKDYDRGETVSALSNFLRDPTGDLPWDEDPAAADIYHLKDADALLKFLKKGAALYKRAMIMFYAPWCGYCKVLKPEYVGAAADLKGEALLAAIDVAKPGNSKIRQQYNITGFPTLLYYEKGQFRLAYNGDNKRQAIVDFMRDPNAQAAKKEVVDESWSKDSDVVHFTGQNFDTVLKKAEHALVVFYAPWCGHCKRIKPEFEKAATRVKEEKINGILGAVDATKQPDLAARFGVKGYPTLKYFHKGEYKFDAGHARKEDQIIDFIKNPKEPPPPPPPEKPWAEEESEVRHLDGSNFRTVLRRIKHALVMFYAPWCGHCKSTKPEYTRAAAEFATELNVAFAAVDCTAHQALCAQYDVRGYPTIKYFSHYDRQTKDYDGGRKESDFVLYMQRLLGSQSSASTKSASTKSARDAGFGVNVQLVDDTSFESAIADSQPSFVMFFASWCGHCVTVKPAFSRVATALKEAGSAKAIAIDAAENPKTADFAGVQTLPTFKMYANGKLVAEYSGDRSDQDMLNFVKSQKVKDEL